MAVMYGGNSNSPNSRSSSVTNLFSRYECRNQVKVLDMNIETNPKWILKNIMNECLYQGGENSLRRTLVEIKTFEEVFTGQIVRVL